MERFLHIGPKAFKALAILSFALAVFSSPARCDFYLSIPGLPDYTAAVTDTKYTRTVYVGPDDATLSDTSGGQSQAVAVWCDDYIHTTYVPANYLVFVSTLPSLTYARFGHDSAALTNYERAAWLLLQYPTLQNRNNSTVGALQTAIWSIFDPFITSLGDGTSNYSAQWWLNQIPAGTALSSYDFSSIRILTPQTNCGTGSNCKPGYQEVMTTVGHAPEPGSIVILGSAFVMAIGVRKMRRSRAAKV